jgi:hypothetical protein
VPVEQSWEAGDLFGRISEVERILPTLEQYCAELSTELSGVEVNQRMFRRLGGDVAIAPGSSGRCLGKYSSPQDGFRTVGDSV